MNHVPYWPKILWGVYSHIEDWKKKNCDQKKRVGNVFWIFTAGCLQNPSFQKAMKSSQIQKADEENSTNFLQIQSEFDQLTKFPLSKFIFLGAKK